MSTRSTPMPSGRGRPTHPATVPAASVTTRPALTAAYRWSSALALVAGIAAAVAAFFPAVLARNAPMTAGNARGTAVAILVVAVPTLVVSMVLAARGSRRAEIVWLGALAYILYNSVFFAYGTHFNGLFLSYAAALSLGVWSVVSLLHAVDADELRARFAPGTPVRAVAGYLLVTTAIFAALWLRDIVPAIAANIDPGSLAGTGMVTNPVEMTDLAFGFPLTVLAAVWLWQRRPLGYLLAGAFLVYGVIEAVGVATDQWFGHLSDPSQSVAMVPVFVALALVGMVPLLAFLRGLRAGPAA